MSVPQWYLMNLRDAQEIAARQVFFVLGCQKSGTTWLQHLLNAHPQIACSGEGHFIDVLAPLMQMTVNEYNRLGKTSIQLNSDHLLSSLRFMVDRCLMDYVRASNDPSAITTVGDKTPESALSVPQLQALYPQARFIHIVRDGRDACVSGWAHLQRQQQAGQFADLAAYAAYFAEKHWAGYIIAARQAAAELGDRYLEVRYEDLHAEPVPQMQRLLQFLQVDAQVDCARGCVESASFEQLSGGRKRGEERADSHFRKGVIGGFASEMDPEALQRFEDMARPLMDALGYAPAETPAAT